MNRETSSSGRGGSRLRGSGRGRLIAGAALLILLPACRQQRLLLPAPARLTSGIVIYQDAFYSGQAALVTGDVRFLRGYSSPCVETVDSGDDPYFSVGSESWSNCISSLRVAAGWKATLYDGNDFKGAHVEVTSDIPDLRQVPGGCGSGDFNDCVSSLRVSRQ